MAIIFRNMPFIWTILDRAARNNAARRLPRSTLTREELATVFARELGYLRR